VQVLTVGHSLFHAKVFIQMMEENKIEWIWDVRSSPVSKYAPQYDRRTMESWLCPQFQYTYAGDDLGGRPKDMSLYTDGRVLQPHKTFIRLNPFAAKS